MLGHCECLTRRGTQTHTRTQVCTGIFRSLYCVVACTQIATPEKAFLFDLLALDGPTQAPAASADHPADNTSQQQQEAGPTDSTHQYMAALDKCLCSVLHNPVCANRPEAVSICA